MAAGRKGGYQLDASNLLGDILSETESDAAAESSALEEELQRKRDQEEQQKKAAEEARKAESAKAVEDERRRREMAEFRRKTVKRAMVELKEDEERVARGEPIEPEAQPRMSSDFAQVVHHSGAHGAVAASKRSVLSMVAMAAVLLLVGGGVSAYLLITADFPLDTTSYPKERISLNEVQSNSTGIALNLLIPEVEEPTGPTPAELAANQRDRDNGRSNSSNNGGSRNNDDDDGPPRDVGTLELGGAGVFDSGAE